MDEVIAAVRTFNRFYTQRIGALEARFLGMDVSLAEARLLFEIGHREQPLASDLKVALGMDAGYLSRLLRRFETRGWIVRCQSGNDKRRRHIALTPLGREIRAALDQRQRAEVATMIEALGVAGRRDLVAALGRTRALLDRASGDRSFAIRTFRSGDMGLIASRQSIFYAEAYGWGRAAEIIEGEVTTNFLRNFKPGRDQCWVAEIDGALAGSIFLTDEGADVARLRLFYVEPFARGRGIGNALVTTCVDSARAAEFRAITLWTQTVLESARRIYAGHGFRHVSSAVHHEFGTPVDGETWRLDLRT